MDLRRALPLLAVLFALLALWLGWSGVQPMADARLAKAWHRPATRAGSRPEGAGYAGHAACRPVASGASAGRRRGGDTATAVAAIAKAGRARAGRRFSRPTWTRPMRRQRRFGFGKLALLEAALNEDKAIARVVREPAAARWAWPRRRKAGDVRLCTPALSALTDLRPGRVPVAGYVALRQGGYTISEQGGTCPMAPRDWPGRRQDRPARGRGGSGRRAGPMGLGGSRAGGGVAVRIAGLLALAGGTRKAEPAASRKGGRRRRRAHPGPEPGARTLRAPARERCRRGSDAVAANRQAHRSRSAASSAPTTSAAWSAPP